MHEIAVSDIDPEAMDALLRYIYCDKVEISPTLAIDLLSVANEYQMPRLKLLCEGIIEKGIDADTVSYVYKAAKLYEATHLVNFCREVIMTEWDIVSKTDLFKEQLTIEERSELKSSYEAWRSRNSETSSKLSSTINAASTNATSTPAPAPTSQSQRRRARDRRTRHKKTSAS